MQDPHRGVGDSWRIRDVKYKGEQDQTANIRLESDQGIKIGYTLFMP